MAALLGFGFFGQLVADVVTPIEYRASRLLSQPLWLAVYLYTAAFLLVIAFNRLERYTSRHYFKYIVVFAETPNDKQSETLKSGSGGTPRNELKRVDDDSESDTPSTSRQYIRRTHHDARQTRWISCAGMRSFTRNMWLFCILGLLDAVCFEAFMYNTASIY